jgi:bla regulator protein blaR1
MIELAADHLWQSTVFAAAVALLVLAYRGAGAHVRHGLWLAASLKFLIPFASIIAAGSALGWRSELGAVPDLTLIVGTVSQPFTSPSIDLVRVAELPGGTSTGAGVSLWTALLVIWALGSAVVAGVWLGRWLRVARTVRGGAIVHAGREVAALRRLGEAAGLRRQIPLVVSADAMEPGVFGIARPVLLWPRRISERLSDAQVEAVIAHEVAHVRRRDNLASLAHMVVQTIFWFHPLVWWLSARLVDERERACDEDVIRRGGAADAYAEGILETVRFCVESPLPCVCGVTGSDLTKRIEQIMSRDIGGRLGAFRRSLLAAAAIVSIAGPLAVGVMTAPQLPVPEPVTDATPRFAVTSVKTNRSGTQGGTMRGTPGGDYSGTNLTLSRLVRTAYGLQDSQIVGGPEWFNKDNFDIEAKGNGPAPPETRNQMLRALLHDRFNLRAHVETRELPVYGLVLARSDGRLGPALKVSAEDCPPPGTARGAVVALGGAPTGPVGGRGPGGPVGCGSLQFGPGLFVSKATDIGWLAQNLSNFPLLTGVDRIVLDRTGLKGNYEIELKWTARMPGPQGQSAAAAASLDDVSLFTALQEQLGLKLEPQRAPVPVLIIDSAERPSEN